jgi:hypothetical protein
MRQNPIFARLKLGIVMLLLMLIDVGPVPVTALLALYIVIARPAWFKTIIDEIY